MVSSNNVQQLQIWWIMCRWLSKILTNANKLMQCTWISRRLSTKFPTKNNASGIEVSSGRQDSPERDNEARYSDWRIKWSTCNWPKQGSKKNDKSATKYFKSEKFGHYVTTHRNVHKRLWTIMIKFPKREESLLKSTLHSNFKIFVNKSLQGLSWDCLN